ncbi:MAG: acetolactate synthase large subunit [Chloroflexota bacterium]
MKAAELLVKCLENEGVEYIFGLPGEEILDVLDALSRGHIKFIATRHEQGAALMASAYGRLTGKPGVCLSTLGPGATNLITGIATATLDRAPLVAISGQTSLERMCKETHQWLDLPEVMKPVTKWCHGIRLAEGIPEVVRRAFSLAQEEKPGATFLELPMDVATKDVSGNPLKIPQKEIQVPTTARIKTAVRLIGKAKFPVVIAGGGVIRANASKELTAFAEKLGLPVAQTFMGIGSIPRSHPLARCILNLQAQDWSSSGLDEADLVITVGYDHIDCSPQFWNRGKVRQVLHIDRLPAEVDACYTPELEIVAEIGKTLEMLTGVCEVRKSSPVSQNDGGARRELERYQGDDSFPLKPQRVISDLRKVIGEDDILVSDVGAHKLWLARLYPAQRPGELIISNGFAPMGYGVPTAISAKLAYPEKKAVVVMGDGGFWLNAQEMETAKRLGVAFVSVIWVDNSYGLIEWKQMNRFGRAFGVRFTNPDFMKYAASLGLSGCRINKAREFLPALCAALKEKLPSIIEVPIDYGENHRLLESL